MINLIRNKILTHISDILKVPADSLHDDMIFGVDIIPSFVSDFKPNELDILIEDMRDACSGEISKEWDKGKIKEETIGEYIEHMIRCYSENQNLVNMIIDVNKN